MSLDLLFPNFETLIRTPEDVARLNEAILQLAVQGKLMPQTPADEPASELLKRIRAEKRRLVKEGKIRDEKPLPPVDPADEPFPIPHSWRWARVDHVTLLVTDGEHVTPPRADRGEVPLVTAKNIRDGYLDLSMTDFVESAVAERSWQRCRPESEDIMMVCVGATTGRLCRAINPPDMVLVRSVALIRPCVEGIAPHYLEIALRSPNLQDHIWSSVKRTAQPCLYINRMKALLLAVPPLAEQQRIIAKVESLFAQTRALEAKLRQAQADIVTVNRAALNRLSVAADDDAFAATWVTVRDAFDLLYDDLRNVAELRQAILQLAVQGKLVPQDPADEPASELLKRIRAEKRRLVKEGKIREEKSLPLAAAGQVPYQLPEGWSWGHFIDVANIATESTDPDEFPDLPHIAPDNIEKSTGRLLEYRTVSEDEVRSVNHHSYPGQILYSKIRPNLSKAVIVEVRGFV